VRTAQNITFTAILPHGDAAEHDSRITTRERGGGEQFPGGGGGGEQFPGGVRAAGWFRRLLGVRAYKWNLAASWASRSPRSYRF